MEEEFTRLYSEIYKDLYRFALYTLDTKEDAEDAVSDAIVDAYASFDKLRDRNSFRSWMFAILSAKCKKRLKIYANKTLELNEEIAETENLVMDESSIEDNLDLKDAMERLNERERLIINMSVIAGYEGLEIAEYLGMNHNTVRTVRRRALDKMRFYLTGKVE